MTAYGVDVVVVVVVVVGGEEPLVDSELHVLLGLYGGKLEALKFDLIVLTFKLDLIILGEPVTRGTTSDVPLSYLGVLRSASPHTRVDPPIWLSKVAAV
jgi:hypothetical protein